jgi:DNA invertase Pin-like site-specific DNA recombinase
MDAKVKARVIIYTRFSSDNQSDLSTARQLERCKEICKREGFEIIGIFSDEATTGTNTDRPQYQKAINTECDGIVTEDTDRVWRDQADLWAAMKILKRRAVFLVTRSLDTRRRGYKRQLASEGAGAEEFSDRLAERVKETQLEKFKRGSKEKSFSAIGRVAGTSYGYIPGSKSASRRVEIDPKTSKIVIEIFKRYAAGESPAAIAEVLNARGVPSPRGGKWLANTIVGVRKRGTGILNCELYIGQYVYGHMDRADREAPLLHVPRERWMRAEWAEMAFLPDGLWAKVRKMQEARSSRDNNVRTKGRNPNAGPGRKPMHLLTGILACGNCGANFVANGVRDYVCPYVRTGACKPADGRKSVPPRRFRRDAVNQNMVALLKQELTSKDAIARAQSDFRAAIEQHAEMRKKAKAVTALPAEIAELDARIAKLRARLKKGDPELADDDLQALIQRNEAKKKAATDALEAKHGAAQDETMITLKNLPALMKDYERKIEDALKVFANPKSVHIAREAIRGMIDGGRVHMKASADGSGLEGQLVIRGIGAQVLKACNKTQNLSRNRFYESHC